MHLVHWLDHGFLRTLEPHLFARLSGGRDVLIAYQVAGGPQVDEQCWKVIDVTEVVTVADTEHFACSRDVPDHLQELVRAVYASAGPPATPSTCSSLALPRR